jgi:pimeloyl-ACP methyl ester carboxylesterase
VPTLIVWGEEEKSIPLPIGQALHKLLKGSRLEILEQAGHCSNIDQYEHFNQLSLEFLSLDTLIS